MGGRRRGPATRTPGSSAGPWRGRGRQPFPVGGREGQLVVTAVVVEPALPGACADGLIQGPRADQVPANVVVVGKGLQAEMVAPSLPVPQPIDGWIDLVKPNGVPYGGNPVLGPKSKTLGPGQSITKTVRFRIGGSVPPSGPYITRGSVGSFAGGAIHTSDFRFLVE